MTGCKTGIAGLQCLFMIHFSRCIALLIVCGALLSSVDAQTATVIPANEAAAHVNKYATKAFTSKSGNTFLNIGASYPNQTFTGWIPPASPVSKSALLSDIEGKRVKISGRIEMYKGKPEIRINAASQLEIESIIRKAISKHNQRNF
jgi:hypothetical protein